MPKRKVQSPTKIHDAISPVPYDEMSWCHNRHIRIYINMESLIEKGSHKMTGMYQVVAEQGNRIRRSEFKYTKHDIAEAVHDAYRKTYQLNYGKEKIN